MEAESENVIVQDATIFIEQIQHLQSIMLTLEPTNYIPDFSIYQWR